MAHPKITTASSAYHDHLALWKSLLKTGLEEDHWQLDWTTLGTVREKNRRVKARVVAKSEGVWAASGVVEAVNGVAADLGAAGSFKAKAKVADGTLYKKGTVVCEWTGPARLVLALERPFLNLASYVGGIATRTRRFVDIVERACPKNTPRVTATRKTLPGYRDVALYGVQAGGGYSHRVNLAGGVLIKENHIASAGGIPAAIRGARAVAPHLLKIEIEVTNEKELKQALSAGIDVVMLDNFSPAQVHSALKVIASSPVKPLVEISGGLNESTIAEYALPGVHILSVGSLTHSVHAVDLSLLVD